MAALFPGARLIETAGFFARMAPDPAEAWSVIHTTANLGSAVAQATYAARPNPGVTATFWVDRDGSVVQGLPNPLLQAPWTNGVWQNPDRSNPRIAAAFAANVNPNRRSLVTIENVSLEPGSPITPQQEATCGAIIAWAHALAGLSISRETVIGHYQITSRDRPNCPARNKAVIDRIVTLAQNGEDMDATTNIPIATCTVLAGGTLYADPGRQTVIAANWPGGSDIGLYAMPQPATVNGKAALAPIRIDTASGPATRFAIGWVGQDKVAAISCGQDDASAYNAGRADVLAAAEGVPPK